MSINRLVLLPLAALFVCGHAVAQSVCLTLEMQKLLALKGKQASEAATQLSRLCTEVKLPPTPSGALSLKEAIMALVGPTRRAAQDRLKPTAPTGMPAGTVMPVNGQVVLDFSSVAAEGVTSIEVQGPGVRLQQREAGTGSLVLAAAQLQPGQDYKWTLRTRRQTYDGTFSLPDAAKTERVQGRLRQLPTLSDNPITLLLLEAAIYDDEDIYASRDATVAKLRRELQ